MCSRNPTKYSVGQAFQPDFRGKIRLESLAYRCVGLLLVLLIPACGTGLINPRGRVLKDGQPVVVQKGEQLMVTFWPYVGDDKLADDLFPAAVNQKEGTFECRGRKFKGIPPGKYRIALKLAVGIDSDKWHGAINAKKSPFVFDLANDKEELVLEIGTHVR